METEFSQENATEKSERSIEKFETEFEQKFAGKLDYVKPGLQAFKEAWFRQALSILFFIAAYAQYHLADPNEAWNIAFYLVTGICLAFESTKKIAFAGIGIAILYQCLSWLVLFFAHQPALVAIILGFTCLAYARKK